MLVRRFYAFYTGTDSQTARSDTETKDKGKTNRRLQAWHVFLVVGILATGAYFLIPSQSAQDTLRPLFTVAALGAAVVGILLHRPRRPMPWYLIASAILLFVFGIVAYVYYDVTTGRVPVVSMADVF